MKRTLLIMAVIFFVIGIWLSFDLNILTLNDPEIKEDTVPATAYSYPVEAEIIRITATPAPLVRKTNVPIEPVYLRIPVLGVGAPVIFEPTTNDNRIYSALEKGVVHYAGTSVPGDSGTSVIIGHSSAYPWYKGKYGSVFSRLSELKEGDTILIEKNGKTITYNITKSIIFSPKSEDDYALRELENTGDDSSVVLMTCWPTGTNSKRIAVRAELI